MFQYYITILLSIISYYIILELIIGFAGDVSVSESENATLSITFSSAFATNFNINVGPPKNDSLSLREIGKSIMISFTRSSQYLHCNFYFIMSIV